ncbi:MAG: M48 family metallopeptidase [bacterium]
MKKGPSIATRVVLALVLTICFYALALAIVGALFYLPYAEIRYAHRIHVKLVLGAVIGGCVILWAIIPRRDRFEAPGPVLRPAQHPKLFEVLRQVATRTGQEMPLEVYLVSDLNAFVSERGGALGMGSRRIMGIGLPLLQALSASEFLGVMAHEFGHFAGSDTKLGGWIYRTRSAIIRTVTSLDDDSWLQKPFMLYAKMFLRITNGVSRQQEYAADRLAAEMVGAAAMKSGLRRIHVMAPAYDVYWRSELVPSLQAGFRPPAADGFRQFIEHPKISEKLSKLTDEQMKEEKTDPYDTHPSLPDRLQALDGMTATATFTITDQPAIQLLTDLPEMEKELFEFLGRANGVEKPLQTVAWAEMGSCVLVPAWRAFCKDDAHFFARLTPACLPELLRVPRKLPRDMVTAFSEKYGDQTRKVVRIMATQAIGLGLVARGWTVESLPGDLVYLCRDGRRVAIFDQIEALEKDSLTDDAWRAFCAESGITELDLGNPEAVPQGS